MDCKYCGEKIKSGLSEEYCPKKTSVSKSTSVTGLGADADYAYKDIAEFEEIIKCKVNDAFKDGWNMARTTNKQLRALAGEEEGP